tara:strand:- start:419 stop:625 length:207 start_codon:yes stop_codon:yes gene_type:complete
MDKYEIEKAEIVQDLCELVYQSIGNAKEIIDTLGLGNTAKSIALTQQLNNIKDYTDWISIKTPNTKGK